VVALGAAQTLAWASSYYLLAILANPIARDLGIGPSIVFGAFSSALMLSALLGPLAGRAIDMYGGRPVLVLTSIIFAAGLGMLALATGLAQLFAAWLILGTAMASGLYEAAFSTLARLYGMAARGPITGITLLAGFASTIGWPVTAWMELHWGWRGACLGWAVMHLTIALPLNLSLPRAEPQSKLDALPQSDEPEEESVVSSTAAVLLAIVFATTWFVSTAMAAHLPRILQANGISLSSALFFAGLVGPAQVAARVLEFGLLRRVNPLLSARIATALHPIGAILFIWVGGPAGAVFALMHGAGNGILTIAKGTLPLLVFGPTGYGARQGFLMIPARFAMALAPFAFGLAVDRFGVGALWISAAIGLTATVALILLRLPMKGDEFM
jgi:MFS family permease